MKNKRRIIELQQESCFAENLLNVVCVHDDENTEQGNGYTEVHILQSGSDFGSQHLGKPLLNSNKRLLWIHTCALSRYWTSTKKKRKKKEICGRAFCSSEKLMQDYQAPSQQSLLWSVRPRRFMEGAFDRNLYPPHFFDFGFFTRRIIPSSSRN